jgi:hypothetical protein
VPFTAKEVSADAGCHAKRVTAARRSGRGEEPTLIAIAAQLEKALGGWLDPDAP